LQPHLFSHHRTDHDLHSLLPKSLVIHSQPFVHHTDLSGSHPVHPATVHFPIAFLTLANTLNLIYGSMIYLPISPFFANDKENLATLTILGYGSNVLGILSSIPAIVTGGAELVAMIQGNGLYQTDKSGQKTLIPKVKMTLMHVCCFTRLYFGWWV